MIFNRLCDIGGCSGIEHEIKFKTKNELKWIDDSPAI